MAYLDLAAGLPADAIQAAAAPVRRLGSQERLVVLLSRKDPLWSLGERSTGSRLVAWLFGVEAPHRLADTRLEALRRYAVTYRLRAADLDDAERAVAAAGFAASELTQVRRLIDAARGQATAATPATLLRRAIFALAGALLFASLVGALVPAFDSALIAFVVVAVAGLTFAPLAAKTEGR